MSNSLHAQVYILLQDDAQSAKTYYWHAASLVSCRRVVKISQEIKSTASADYVGVATGLCLF